MKAYLGILLGILFINFAHATSLEPSHYPVDLMYLGYPLDPLCLTSLSSDSSIINLKKCGLFKDKYKISGKNDYLVGKGFYGFDWQDVSDKEAALSNIVGAAYYKAWNAGNHQYWLFTVFSNGGSGDFTSIDLYTRKNANTVELKTIDGGDRCNGGINQVLEKGRDMAYSVNITAFDFLGLAGDNPHNLKAYDDLAACATCCAAVVYYAVDTKLKPKLMYVDLGADAKAEEMSTQGKYQGCLNKIVARYVAAGKVRLDEGRLKGMVREFNETCVEGTS